MGQSQTKKQIKYGNQANPKYIEPTFDEQRKNKFIQERERDVEHMYHSEQPRVLASSLEQKSKANNNNLRSFSAQKTLQTLKFQRIQKELRDKDPTLVKIREINRSQKTAQFFLNAIQMEKINCSLIHTIPMNYNIHDIQERQQEAKCCQKKSDATKFLKLIEEKNRMEIQQIQKFDFQEILVQSTDFINDYIDENNMNESNYNIFKQERSKFEQSTRVLRNKDTNKQQFNSLNSNNDINSQSTMNKSHSEFQKAKILQKGKISFNDFNGSDLEVASEKVKQSKQSKEEYNNKMKLSSLVKNGNNSEQNSTYNSSLQNKNSQHYKSNRKNSSSNKENDFQHEYKISSLPKNSVINTTNPLLFNKDITLITQKGNSDKQYNKPKNSNIVDYQNNKIQNNSSNILKTQGYDKENSFCKPQSGSNKGYYQNNNYQNENKNTQNLGFLSERQNNNQYEIKNRLNSNTDYSEPQFRSKNNTQDIGNKPIVNIVGSENISSNYIQELSPSMILQGKEQRKIDVNENQKVFQQNSKLSQNHHINSNIYLPIEQINNYDSSRSISNNKINFKENNQQINKQQENKTNGQKNLITTYVQQIITNDSYQNDFKYQNSNHTNQNINNNNYVNQQNYYQNDKQKDKKKIIQLNGKTYSQQSSNQNVQDLQMNTNQQYQNNIQYNYNNEKQIQNNNTDYLPENQDYTDIIQSRKSSLNSYFTKNKQNILNEFLDKKQKPEENSPITTQIHHNNEQNQIQQLSLNSKVQPVYQNKQGYDSSSIKQQTKHLQSSTNHLTPNKYQHDNTQSTIRKNSRNNMGASLQRINCESEYKYQSDDPKNKMSSSVVFSSLLTQTIVKPKEDKFNSSQINKDYEEYVPQKVSSQSQFKSQLKNQTHESQFRNTRHVNYNEDSIIQISKLDSKIKQLSDERTNSPFCSKNFYTPRQQSKPYI